ncbi:MAG: hypothetical protein HYY46_13190 [Deltaproteobacteria bacterium]|nr:hypothetical protein [Deltaproteobacteria bacterium]
MEVIVSWGAVLIGLIVCTFVGRLLIREVRAGKRGRFSATVIYGLAVPVMGAVPLIIAAGVRWLGSLAGFAVFSGNGGNDGNLVGVGIMGFVIAFGATVLFAAVMLFQAFTGSGNSSVGDQR